MFFLVIFIWFIKRFTKNKNDIPLYSSLQNDIDGIEYWQRTRSNSHRIWRRTDYFLQPVVGVGGETKDNRINAKFELKLICYLKKRSVP